MYSSGILTNLPSDNVETLRALGAEPVVCDVFDPRRVRTAVFDFRPDLVMHQLTDLPDDFSRVRDHPGANARIRQMAAESLGKFGPAARESLDDLRKLLADGNAGVRKAASAAVLAITEPTKKGPN